jgi:hypothetical protein
MRRIIRKTRMTPPERSSEKRNLVTMITAKRGENGQRRGKKYRGGVRHTIKRDRKPIISRVLPGSVVLKITKLTRRSEAVFILASICWNGELPGK